MLSMMKPVPTLVVILLATFATKLMASPGPNEIDRVSQAVELYYQAVGLDQQSPAKSTLLKQSESILLDVISDHPESLDAQRKLMGVYLQMRDYRKAIQTMQTAITLSPEDPKLFIALAILYDHQGAYEYAVPILDQALLLDPENQLALDYKVSIQQKIESQNLAMESSTPAHKIATPDPMDEQPSR